MAREEEPMKSNCQALSVVAIGTNSICKRIPISTNNSTLEPSEVELFADMGICDSFLSMFKNSVVHLPVFTRPLVGHIGKFTSQMA